MYGILFGCKHFHQCLYGWEVKVEIDLKHPLPIMKKPLHSATPNLQSNYVPTTVSPRSAFYPWYSYTRSKYSVKEISFCHLPQVAPTLGNFVHSIGAKHGVSDRRLNEILSTTAQNEQFQTLETTILHGWPNERSLCAAEIRKYWNQSDYLTCTENIILKGHKIVILHEQRSEIPALYTSFPPL
jgi:hypothetical protein